MPPDVPKWLEDIRDAAQYVLSVTDGKSVDEFANDRTLRLAVERSFEIIGEALHRIARADAVTAAKLSYSERIIAFRNVLAHGYDIIEVEVVWDVICNHLPRLYAEVEEILDSAE